MSEDRSAPAAWDRERDESAAAHAAFMVYLDLGPGRTFVAAARALAKNERLIRRWAARYRWRERAWRRDLHQASQDEAVVRQQRETVLRERLEDLDRMGRACLAFFRTMIRRDPETGDVSFDARFTPQIALRFLELTLRAQGAFERPAAEETSGERPAADLFGLADAELVELIDLARQRADQQHQGKDNGNEPDQGSTQQGQHEEQEGEEDEAERD